MVLPNEPPKRRPAVFIDRDGTIMQDVDYCGDPGLVEVFAGVSEALRELKERGFQIVVITNQSGIGRGYFSEQDYRAVEMEVARKVGLGLIDATYFCADLPDSGSKRRKPEAGMILEAQRDHHVDLTRSFMIGDKAIDVECGRKAGVRTILVQTGPQKHNGASGADWEAPDLPAAAKIILSHVV